MSSKKKGPFRLDQRQLAVYFDIHSWFGVVGGIALFICCFSGSLALFEREILDWEIPQSRREAIENPVSIDELVRIAYSELPTAAAKQAFVWLPGPNRATFNMRANDDEGNFVQVHLDPVTGEVVPWPESSAFRFLTHLHTDLHLPRPFGRYLVGFLGVFMMVSLISGVLAHPKVLQQLFLMRWRPRLSLTVRDLHVQLGAWGLVFGSVMAFTGAVIGLLGLFAPVMVLSAFDGDVEKASEAFFGASAEETGVDAEMRRLEPLIERVESEHPAFEVRSFTLRNHGDEAAEVGLNLEHREHRSIVSGETHQFSLVTGEAGHVAKFTNRGLGTRLFGAVQPLHYGEFGGLGLRLIYFVSGAVLSLGIATGNVLWFERRRRRDGARRSHFVLRRLTLGACLGLVLASVACIGCGRFVGTAMQPVFWSVWLLSAVVAFVPGPGIRLLRWGAFASAAGALIIGVADLAFSPLLTPRVVRVDLVLIGTALFLGAGAALLPSKAAD
ncbi:MAG: PepSY-associated TM helix domain-containing protein [Acidobacteriota bacterium]